MTAVEWLIKELKDFGYYTYNLEKLCEQAKEIEKQQIMDARLNGFMISGEGYNGEYPYEGKDKNIISKEIDNEQYYNETFKKICEHHYITSADWKSQTCSKCSHRINL